MRIEARVWNMKVNGEIGEGDWEEIVVVVVVEVVRVEEWWLAAAAVATVGARWMAVHRAAYVKPWRQFMVMTFVLSYCTKIPLIRHFACEWLSRCVNLPIQSENPTRT
ncbi:hypothetical protein Hanom_Chr12g01178501 [Helianthus anomalus]